MEQLSSRDSAILNCVFNPHLPLDDTDKPELKDEEELTPEILRAKTLEKQAIISAEQGYFQKAEDLINEAINIAPNKASLYNNRGHIFQFQRKFEEAMVDVTKAIVLAQDTDLRKTLCQAHVQRGVLHRRNDDLDSAREDFRIAADMGDIFAKNQIVELNPYAALCNQMLRQVTQTWN
ncbi:hypothetical protein HHI36_015159 [Cryptolaemus montrouzieri]|uniref:Tetratricopeptide repeat protein 36 n=1 Tax=Cryptolaemus montrouzieri TaxID=559131 RepID=A0ABD2N4V5_9CUCU